MKNLLKYLPAELEYITLEYIEKEWPYQFECDIFKIKKIFSIEKRLTTMTYTPINILYNPATDRSEEIYAFHFFPYISKTILENDYLMFLVNNSLSSKHCIFRMINIFYDYPNQRWSNKIRLYFKHDEDRMKLLLSL